MSNQYLEYKISLQHLKEDSCIQLLQNAGWRKNIYDKKVSYNKLLTEYSMKYPEMNLEKIQIMNHPLLNTNIQDWTNDKRVNNERLCNYYPYQMNEGYFNDVESFGCELTNGEKIERNWDITKHFIGQISIWDLNDYTKKIVLHKSGWLKNINDSKKRLNIAINNYSLHFPNSNLWNFRIVKNDDISWDIARCFPYLV
jgi:hypothetical protein